MERSPSARPGREHAGAGDDPQTQPGPPATGTGEITREEAGREADAAPGSEGGDDEPRDDKYVPL